MYRRNYFFLFTVIFLLAVQNIYAQVKFHDITLNQALKIAKDTNKKVLVYLYTIPCPACTLLTRNIFENPEIGKFINSNYVCLKFYGDKVYNKYDSHTSLIEKYEIGRGFPVVLLLKSDGKYIDRIRGFGDKDDYWITLKNYTKNLYTPEYYRNKLKTNPKDCEAMIALAKKYHDRHMIKEAINWFESSIKYDSCKKNALTWFVLSRLYTQQGNSRKALFACEIAAELDPENTQIKSVLVKLKAVEKK